MTDKQPKSKEPKPPEPAAKYVRVKVLRAIGIGGISLRPPFNRSKLVPLETVIPEERAIAHGPDDVEVIEPATEADFRKAMQAAADRQRRPAVTK